MDASTEPDVEQHATEERSRLALSIRDSRTYVHALLNLSPVNDRLRDTVRRYRESI
jgi:hypothetical protein